MIARLTAVLLMLASPALAADTIVGRATVVDGDTIEIQGQRIRLNGIDAPESWQRCTRAGKEYRCGREAAVALDEWLAEARPTACEKIGQDRYKRWIADCRRADGAEVNAWLVRSGWALDWPKYSGGRYAAEQRAAEAERLGIWAGEFERPCAARDRRAKRRSTCE